jgi:hypothetical protein
MMIRILLAACLALFPGLSVAESPSAPSGPTVPVVGGKYYDNLTADTAVKSVKGSLVGIFVASSTSCTIKVWDNTSAATTVLVNTFSASAATWYPLPFVFNTGLYVDVGGTCDLTVSYN